MKKYAYYILKYLLNENLFFSSINKVQKSFISILDKSHNVTIVTKKLKYVFIIIKLSTKTYLTGVCYDLNDTEG